MIRVPCLCRAWASVGRAEALLVTKRSAFSFVSNLSLRFMLCIVLSTSPMMTRRLFNTPSVQHGQARTYSSQGAACQTVVFVGTNSRAGARVLNLGFEDVERVLDSIVSRLRYLLHSNVSVTHLADHAPTKKSTVATYQVASTCSLPSDTMQYEHPLQAPLQPMARAVKEA